MIARQLTDQILAIKNLRKNIISSILAVVVAFTFASCGSGGGGSTVLTYDAFGPPEFVPISGYSSDVMEPFFSRDGLYMFFNNFAGPTEKDIYYASYDESSDTFTYEAIISNINTPAVEGVPTLDNNNNNYYVSTYNYPPNNANIFDTIYVGQFDPVSVNIVDSLAVVPNLDQETLGHLNFDVEVSPDGTVLYFVDGIFSGAAFPDVSNFVYATGSGSNFTRAADSAAIFAEINTDDLEYAACISADGLEFFFTRLDPDTLRTRIFRTTRTGTTSPFGPPQQITSITGFVEAPTLSPDEKQLYYHKRNPTSGLFELYRVTRP